MTTYTSLSVQLSVVAKGKLMSKNNTRDILQWAMLNADQMFNRDGVVDFRFEGFQSDEDLGRIFAEACVAVGEAR